MPGGTSDHVPRCHIWHPIQQGGGRHRWSGTPAHRRSRPVEGVRTMDRGASAGPPAHSDESARRRIGPICPRIGIRMNSGGGRQGKPVVVGRTVLTPRSFLAYGWLRGADGPRPPLPALGPRWLEGLWRVLLPVRRGEGRSSASPHRRKREQGLGSD